MYVASWLHPSMQVVEVLSAFRNVATGVRENNCSSGAL